MTKLSNNFTREEFECPCGCGQDTVDAELITLLQKLREDYDASVTVNSANRCEAHNESVGGADSSQHLLGRAADIVVSGIDPHEVWEYLCDKYRDKYGIGQYKTFTHIDTRNGKKARW